MSISPQGPSSANGSSGSGCSTALVSSGAQDPRAPPTAATAPPWLWAVAGAGAMAVVVMLVVLIRRKP